MNLSTLENSARVIDEAALGVRRHDEQRHPKAEPESVDLRRRDVIIEPAEVIPGDEHRGVPPLWPRGERLNQTHRPVLTVADWPGRVLGHPDGNGNPAHRRKPSAARVLHELLGRNEVLAPLVGIAKVADRVVGRPLVAVLQMVRIVGRRRRIHLPAHARLAQLVAEGRKVEAGVDLLDLALLVEDGDLRYLRSESQPQTALRGSSNGAMSDGSSPGSPGNGQDIEDRQGSTSGASGESGKVCGLSWEPPLCAAIVYRWLGKLGP